MSQTVALPHIYYTISELWTMKDISKLKNLNVKTMGHIREGRAFEFNFENNSFDKFDKWIQLDLRHVNQTVYEMKPYIIMGVLYSLNHSLALCVKSLKQFDADFENLIVYHNNLLQVRKKSIHFKNVNMLDE